ncbi:MAG: AzlD domain-containing protein [Hyphomicrobiaceae bacterium]|nr:branched-chain amino acid ABC transporter [Hyphomicrobiaceae bacterium]
MTFDQTILIIIAVMTAAAAACRLAGFWFMRLIPITPRVEAGLKAIPIAVMIGIIVPPVIKGGIPETVGLIATMAVVKLGANDLIAVLIGMASVAATRALL